MGVHPWRHLFGNDFVDCTAVSAEEVDAYLRDLEEPKRSTLETLRRTFSRSSRKPNG